MNSDELETEAHVEHTLVGVWEHRITSLRASAIGPASALLKGGVACIATISPATFLIISVKPATRVCYILNKVRWRQAILHT
jgi:hypothetical protein